MNNMDALGLNVVCLCAAWCGVCRQYQVDFQKLQHKLPHVHFVWVDVEDQEDVLGEVDVETFPTLLIARGPQALFLGPLLPQVPVLERLLQAYGDGAAASKGLDPQAQGLWERLVQQ